MAGELRSEESFFQTNEPANCSVEAAEVAESAGERDRRDGPVGEAGIQEFTA